MERVKTSSADVVKEQLSVETATCAVVKSVWQHRVNPARRISVPVATTKKVPLLQRHVRYARNRTADFVFQFALKKNAVSESVETAEATGAAATPAANIFVLIINCIVLLEGARLHSARNVLQDHATMKRKAYLGIFANIARIYARRNHFFVLHVPMMARSGSVLSAKMSLVVPTRTAQ